MIQSKALKLTALTIAVAAICSQANAQTAQYYLTRDGQRMTLEQYQQSTVLKQGGVLEAWARGLDGTGVRIAVLDQGFNTNHWDLKGQVESYEIFYPGRSYKTNYGVHGTSMASIIAGNGGDGIGTVGVAPGAKLLLGQIGSGGTTTSIHNSALIAGLAWADSQKADIVNLSIASNFDAKFRGQTKRVAPGVYLAPERYGSLYGKASTLEALKGVNNSSVIVTAAGNQGVAYAAFPGAFATQVDSNGELVFGGRWLIVGSVDANNKISRFSNQAGHICTDLQGTVCKDPYQVKDFYVVAPGERVIVARDTGRANDYMATVSSGSSASTAYVSGGLALMKQAWPHLKAAQLVDLVKTTATDLGAPGVDEVYGHGLVNFDKATQPYAAVKYTTSSLTSTSTATGTPVTQTGITGTMTTALANSQVLKNVQVVDGLNRNYTVDFTRAIGTTSPTSTLYTSPYLAMQATGYNEVKAQVTKNMSMTMMQTNSGIATQLETNYGANKLMFQVGAMSEQDSFLSNKGTGLFATGGSSTSYMMLGGSVPMGNGVEAFGNYGLGHTNTNNVASSFLNVSNLVSDTWKLGLAKSDIFFSGKTQDTFTMALSTPVGIRSGHADVTAVTSYNYAGDGEDITAVPVTSTERVSLATSRPVNLSLGYAVNTSNVSQVGFSVNKQMTSGTSPAIGFTFRTVF